MKTTFRLVFLLGMALVLARPSAFSQTAFTYQGSLSEAGAPAQGLYDLRFKLFLDPLGNTQAGSSLLTNAVPVSNGLFTVTLDFGPGIFDGSNYWLDVGVKTNGGSAYADLAPLQPLTPVPYALFAANIGAVPADALGGLYGGLVSFNNVADQFTGAFTGAFVGNGASLSNVNAQTLGGLGSSNLWRTAGNAGTSPASGNFIGTTDQQPFEIHAGGLRALRLEPDPRVAGLSDNIIGGYISNAIQQPNSGGDVIVGGGYSAGVNIIASNSSGDFIGAGSANLIGSNINDCVIAGGYGNTIKAADSLIGGGMYNTVAEQFGVIAGGYANQIGLAADHSSIGGGQYNSIIGSYALPVVAVIGGGSDNIIDTNASYPVIGGGFQNLILPNALYATIPGGFNNSAAGECSFAAGRLAQADHDGAFVWADNIDSNFPSVTSNEFAVRATGGVRLVTDGAGLTVDGAIVQPALTTLEDSTHSNIVNVVDGAPVNYVAPGVYGATIAGGGAGFYNVFNYISNSVFGDFGAIGGGENNQTSGYGDVIGGGSANRAYASWSAIGGGFSNIASNEAVIAGGFGNTATGDESSIGGGNENQALGTYSTIPGGYNNLAYGSNTFAAGTQAEAINNGCFAWAGGNTVPYPTIFDNSFNVYAVNGLSIDYDGQNGTGRGNRWFYVGTENVNHTVTVWNGAYLSDAGVWANASDKNRKTDFQEIDHNQVLDRLAAMPVRQWRYTNEAPAIKHIGPTAQDFKAAFGLGDDDRAIGTIDEGGVALAALQALNQKLQDQGAKLQAQNDALQRQNQSLASRLDALTAAFQRLSTPKP